MKNKILLVIITLIISTLLPSPIFAQEDRGPTYIVQPGENLSTIANKFGININDLIAINNITDSNLISAGTELMIPGLEGISGVLSVKPIELGETIPLILKKYDMGLDDLLKLNKLTSPSEVYVGTNLVLPNPILESTEEQGNFFSLGIKSSILIESISKNLNHWSFSIDAQSTNTSFQVPSSIFEYKEETPGSSGSIFSPYIESVVLEPLPASQGHTSVLKVFISQPVNISGTFDGHPLTFYLDESGVMQYSLDSIHALRTPGLAQLIVDGTFESGESFHIDQMVLIESGGYVNETLTVESTLINEELNKQEAAKVQEILAETSAEKYWAQPFRYPVDGSLEDETIGFSSYFGNRRSYNNGEYSGFHGGLDFYVLLNTFNIYAPAPGVVAYAGPMDIRGFTTFIDHGQGVFSGYAHQSEILVEEGQFVNTGDLIGLIGNTGRVTGPHLHWDIWVNGNQVDPFDWIYNQYP